MIASCGFLDDALRQVQQGRRSDDGRRCGNAGSRLENQNQEFGSERKKARRKKCTERFSLIKKNKALPEELHEGGSQEAAASGHGASKNVGSACSGDGSPGKVKN